MVDEGNSMSKIIGIRKGKSAIVISKTIPRMLLRCPSSYAGTPLVFFIRPGASQDQLLSTGDRTDKLISAPVTHRIQRGQLSLAFTFWPPAGHPFLSLVSGADSIQIRGGIHVGVAFLSALESLYLAIRTSCIVSDVLNRASTGTKSLD